MKDITRKPESLRSARATCTLIMPPECLTLLKERKVEKGDALETAKIAGIMAAKKTSELLPYCHPLNILDATIDYEFLDDALRIESEVRLIGATGVEMEALTAAQIAALTIYDMLKPHCDQERMRITDGYLLGKRGGKSHYKRASGIGLTAKLLFVSDPVATGNKPDKAGQAIRNELAQSGIDVSEYAITEADRDTVYRKVEQWLTHSNGDGPDLIITLGGTGLGDRDITVDAIEPLIKRPLPGIMETARTHGQRRTPFALISRGIAGQTGHTIVVTLPGSTNGAVESWDAICAGLLHALETQRATRK